MTSSPSLQHDSQPPEAPIAANPPPRRKRADLQRRNLPLLMLMARESVTSCFRPIFNEFKLTEQQWRITRALYEEGELMISQLSERTFIVGPSLSGILQRMVESDLVVKRLDPVDTRRFYVSLTRAGRARFEAMAPKITQAYEQLEKRLGKTELDQLYDVMDRVLALAAPSADAPE